MGDLLIRGLAPETHEELKRRAQDAGVSLQTYVARLLERSTAVPAALLSMMSAPGTTPAVDQVAWMALVGRRVRTSLAPSPLPRGDLARLHGVPTSRQRATCCPMSDPTSSSGRSAPRSARDENRGRAAVARVLGEVLPCARSRTFLPSEGGRSSLVPF